MGWTEPRPAGAVAPCRRRGCGELGDRRARRRRDPGRPTAPLPAAPCPICRPSWDWTWSARPTPGRRSGGSSRCWLSCWMRSRRSRSRCIPTTTYALRREGNELGKTEMWVVLAAKPGAELILGVRPGTTREAFREALVAGHPEPFLHRVPVRVGDHLCVPAGMVHAILDGIMVAEIQQNSNTTYRVFDWNRPGADGKPRDLHIDKALDVIDFGAVEPEVCPPEVLSSGDGCDAFAAVSQPLFRHRARRPGAGRGFSRRVQRRHAGNVGRDRRRGDRRRRRAGTRAARSRAFRAVAGRDGPVQRRNQARRHAAPELRGRRRPG